MAVALFTDRRMIDHGRRSRHPERPERLQAILRQLERTGYHNTCPSFPVREATIEELGRVHSPEYLAEVFRLEAEGGGMLDPDTWLLPGSVLAARLAAGAADRSGLLVMDGRRAVARCASSARPDTMPAPPRGWGSASTPTSPSPRRTRWRGWGWDRVLIVDFDVHHGNGTQEIFYESSRVGFLSIHRYPFYPGTGARDETGTGAGLGSIANIPVPYGTPRAEYHAAFRAGLEKLADRIRPELVLISAGFDAHAEDPVGDLGLEVEDFEILTKEIVSVAETHAGGRIVSVLEGGYNVPILAGCVVAHLDALGAERGRI